MLAYGQFPPILALLTPFSRSPSLPALPPSSGLCHPPSPSPFLPASPPLVSHVVLAPNKPGMESFPLPSSYPGGWFLPNPWMNTLLSLRRESVLWPFYVAEHWNTDSIQQVPCEFPL